MLVSIIIFYLRNILETEIFEILVPYTFLNVTCMLIGILCRYSLVWYSTKVFIVHVIGPSVKRPLLIRWWLSSPWLLHTPWMLSRERLLWIRRRLPRTRLLYRQSMCPRTWMQRSLRIRSWLSSQWMLFKQQMSPWTRLWGKMQGWFWLSLSGLL